MPSTERVISNTAFAAGARWAFQQSSALAPHIALFIEMMLLLGLLESTDEMVSTTIDGTGDAQTSAGTASNQSDDSNHDLFAMSSNVPIPGTASVRSDA